MTLGFCDANFLRFVGGGPSFLSRLPLCALFSGSGDAPEDEFCDEGGDGRTALEEGLGVRDCNDVNGELSPELTSSSELIVIVIAFGNVCNNQSCNRV